MKEFYYPHIEKTQAFDLGYIAKRSQHTRGAAVDLTLIRKDQAIKASIVNKRSFQNGAHFIFLDDGTLDMFSHFDVFDDASHHDTTLIPDEYLKWRDYLRNAMVSANFNPYTKEWWHYSVQNEPFPETYFNFAIA
jgi:D-alanyl-D-alanine dipeptidase